MQAEDDGIQRSLGRIEGQLTEMKLQIASLSIAFTTLEAGRLSALEKQVANIMGRIAVIVTLISGFVSIAIFIAERYLFR